MSHIPTAALILLLGALVPQLAQADDASSDDVEPTVKEHASVDWLEVGQVTGRRNTLVDLYFYATTPSGRPVLELDLDLSASAGSLGRLYEHGGGLYSVVYEPGRVTKWVAVQLRGSGFSGEQGELHMHHEFYVSPPGGRSTELSPSVVRRARNARKKATIRTLLASR